MRMMVMVELDTPTSNASLASGQMNEVLGQVLGALKPEASYFHPRGGRRAVTLVVDVPDSSYVVSVCEPFWSQMNAHVEMFPCMNLEELQAGLGRLS